MPSVHDSMFAGSLMAKQQGKEEKQKYAKAPPARMRIKTKSAMATLCKDLAPPIDEESDEEEEEVAKYLRGGDPMTSHLTMIKNSSVGEN